MSNKKKTKFLIENSINNPDLMMSEFEKGHSLLYRHIPIVIGRYSAQKKIGWHILTSLMYNMTVSVFREKYTGVCNHRNSKRRFPSMSAEKPPMREVTLWRKSSIMDFMGSLLGAWSRAFPIARRLPWAKSGLKCPPLTDGRQLAVDDPLG